MFKAALQLPLLFALALSPFALRAAEAAPARNDKSAPELAGRADVDSIMRLIMRSGPFADKIWKGSSGMMVLGMAGFSVNPQLAAYDVSKPFSLLVYSNPRGGALGPWDFCVLFQRKTAASKPLVKLLNFDLATKDSGELTALASSQGALTKAFEDISNGASVSPAKGRPDLALEISPQIALKQFLFKDFVSAPLVVDDPQLSPAKVESLKAAALRWAAFDDVLKQVSVLKLSFSVDDAQRASMDLTLDAAKGSCLEAFLGAQAALPASGSPSTISVDGAAVFGAARIAYDDSLVAAAAALRGRIAKATGQEALAGANEEFARALLVDSTGTLAFCVGLKSGDYFDVSRIELKRSDEARARLEKAVARIAGTSPDRPVRLRKWKTGISTYCLLDGDALWLLNGRFGDFDAMALFASRKVRASQGAWRSGLVCYAAFSPETPAPGVFSSWASGGARLSMKLQFTPSDLDKVPLPPAAPAKTAFSPSPANPL